MFGSVSWLEPTIVPVESSARTSSAAEADELPGLVTLATYHTRGSPKNVPVWLQAS
jgi:hypothetical protein